MAFKDFEIHRRARKDDVAAFEKLFRTYYTELVNYSYGFVKDFDAAEEIVQDFFYNYWKNRKEINIRFSVKSYLFRAVRNNSLKYLDAVAVRRRYADRILAGLKEETGYEDTELEYSELMKVIEETLSELPGRCGEVFRMSRFGGMKYEEIAEEMSVSVKTVEANMSKALKLLRDRLGNYFETDAL